MNFTHQSLMKMAVVATFLLVFGGVVTAKLSQTKCQKPGKQCNGCQEIFNCVQRDGIFVSDRKIETCPGTQVCDASNDVAACEPNAICRYKEFECPHTSEDTIIPDPFSCGEYHICTRGKTLNFVCGNDAPVFDPKTKRCVKETTPKNACKDPPIPLCKRKGDRGTIEGTDYMYECMEEITPYHVLYPKVNLKANGGTIISDQEEVTTQPTSPASESTASSTAQPTSPASESTPSSTAQPTSPASESTASSTAQPTSPASESTASSTAQPTSPASESTASSTAQPTSPASESTPSSTAQPTSPASESTASSTAQPTSPASESTASSTAQPTSPASESTASSTAQPTSPASESTPSSTAQPTSPASESTASSTAQPTSPASESTPSSTAQPTSPASESTASSTAQPTSPASESTPSSTAQPTSPASESTASSTAQPTTSSTTESTESSTTQSTASSTAESTESSTTQSTTSSTTESTTSMTTESTTSSTTTQTPLPCTNGVGVYPVPDDCRKYYICYRLPNNTINYEERMCRSGSHFENGRCVAGSCDQFPTTVSPASTETTVAPVQCQSNGLLPDKECCKCYYVCYNAGSELTYEHKCCRNGSHFNSESKRCVAGSECTPTDKC